MNKINQFPIRLICATRLDQTQFFSHTATGRSVKAFASISRVEMTIYDNNTRGLSEVYNYSIEKSIDNPAILVFIHDDILICDFFWGERIRNGLENFDIVGLAGNKRRIKNQPSWAFVDDKFTWDNKENLSGTVGHGKTFPPNKIHPYGPSGCECKLVDGLLIAVSSKTLIESGLRFDEHFKFHFYDLDFCRQAEKLNLKIGTIPLSVLHESGGSFGSKQWKNSYQDYLSKWKS